MPKEISDKVREYPQLLGVLRVVFDLGYAECASKVVSTLESELDTVSKTNI